MTLIPTSDNDLGQDLNYGKRQRSRSPDYEFYADPHSSNSGSWDDSPTDLDAFVKDLDPVDFASLQNNIPTSSVNASMNVARHNNDRKTPHGLFSPPSPKRCRLSPEPSPLQLNSTFTRLASPPPTGADSRGPGSAGTPLSRQSSFSFESPDVWQEGVDGVVVNTQGELPVTGPSSPPLDSHGSVPSQNLMATASGSASPPQYDPALDQHQLTDNAYVSAQPYAVHPIQPSTIEASGSHVPQAPVGSILCRIMVLKDDYGQLILPHLCNFALPRDQGFIRAHFKMHEDRGEMPFNIGECPFLMIPGERPCAPKEGHELESCDCGTHARHVYSKHFANAPREHCAYCPRTFKRFDQVRRHNKKCGPNAVHANKVISGGGLQNARKAKSARGRPRKRPRLQ